MANKTVLRLQADLDKRRSDATDRMNMYARASDAYYGIIRTPGGSVRAQDGQGRPLQRLEQFRSDLKTRKGAPNMIAPLVDDFVALKGTLPTMTIVPEDDTPEALDKATTRTRINRGQYENSRMVLQQKQAAWFFATLGDCAYMLDPVYPTSKDTQGGMRPAGVYLTICDPRMAYPRFRSGYARDELQDLILCWKENADSAYLMWGINTDDEEVDVMQYYSSDEKLTIVNDKIVEQITHNLGFCTAQWVSNKPSGELGQSDISQVLDLHEEYQVQTLVMTDSLIESVFPQKYIVKPKAFPDQIPMGPGTVVPIEEGGSMGQLAPAASPQAADLIVGRTLSAIEQMTGSTPIRTEGAVSGSNLSGRMVHAMQGPMESRLQSFQDIMGHHFQRINQKMAIMLTELPGFKNKEMNVFVVDNQGSHNLTFTSDDIGGWGRSMIEWDSMSGNTRHERVVIALQLQGAGIVTRAYVANQAGISDPERMIKEADDEKKAEMQLQMQMQGGGQPPPPGGAPQGGPGGAPDAQQVQDQAQQPAQDAAAMGGGGMPPSGGPPLGPPGAAPAPGGPPQMPGFPDSAMKPPQTGMGPAPNITSPTQEVESRIKDLKKQRLLRNEPEIEMAKTGQIIVRATGRSVGDKQADIRILKQAFQDMPNVKVTMKGSK